MVAGLICLFGGVGFFFYYGGSTSQRGADVSIAVAIAGIVAFFAGGGRSFLNDEQEGESEDLPRTIRLKACPSCGKRFRVQLVADRLAEEQVGEGEVVKAHGARGTGPGTHVAVEAQRDRSAELVPGLQASPGVVEVETHRYHYRCARCGHEWTEDVRLAGEIVGGEGAGYSGD